MVADPTDAVRAVKTGLARQLTCGDDRGSSLGRDGGDPAVTERTEHAQIGGQPSDGGVRDASVGRDTGDARRVALGGHQHLDMVPVGSRIRLCCRRLRTDVVEPF